jgi:N12 class adenine-specific DNA methylase
MKWIKFKQSNIILLVANAQAASKRVVVAVPRSPLQKVELSTGVGQRLSKLGFRSLSNGTWYRPLTGISVDHILKVFPDDAVITDIAREDVLIEVKPKLNIDLRKTQEDSHEQKTAPATLEKVEPSPLSEKKSAGPQDEAPQQSNESEPNQGEELNHVSDRRNVRTSSPRSSVTSRAREVEPNGSNRIEYTGDKEPVVPQGVERGGDARSIHGGARRDLGESTGGENRSNELGNATASGRRDPNLDESSPSSTQLGDGAADRRVVTEPGGSNTNHEPLAQQDKIGAVSTREKERVTPRSSSKDNGEVVGRQRNNANKNVESASQIDPLQGNYTPSTVGVDSDYRTPTKRIDDNLAAMSLLKRLEGSGEKANFNDAVKLKQFSGWGGLLKQLNGSELDEKMRSEFGVRSLMRARDSALSAFYTPNSVGRSVWDLLVKAGYKGGRALESSAGTGVFLNQRPTEFDKKSHFTAIELEPTSGGILKHTNPKAFVQRTGFERSDVINDSFDLGIGNVPFGEFQLQDSTLGRHAIHNYFLLKNLQAVRDGGIVAIITSPWTMDAKSPDFRQSVADQADLLAVVRLPSKTFSDSQTGVFSDLLVFKKRASHMPYNGIPFIDLTLRNYTNARDFNILGSNGKTISHKKGASTEVSVNEAFLTAHGIFAVEPQVVNSRFGDRAELAFVGDRTEAITAIEALAVDVEGKWFDERNLFDELGPVTQSYTESFARRPMIGSLQITSAGEVGIVSMVAEIDDGKFAAKLSTAKIANRDTDRVKPLIELRDVVAELLNAESRDDDKSMELLREKINTLYDFYVSEFGPLNEVRNRRLLNRDAEGAMMLGLESYDDASKTATKSKIFFQRVVIRHKEATSAASLKEAVSISFSKHGKIVENHVAQLLGKEFNDAINDEPGVIAFDPQIGQWVPREVYLTGNIYLKLDAAKSSLDERVTPNIDLLTERVPPSIAAEDILIDLSSNWIPKEYFIQFVHDQLAHFDILGANVTLTKIGDSRTKLKIESGRGTLESQFNLAMTDGLGTTSRTFSELIIAGIHSTPIKVTSTNSKGHTHELKEESLKATAKLMEITDGFKAWIWQNPDRTSRLEDIYNRNFNGINLEEFSGEGYSFPGLAPHWKPREHQSAMVVRCLMMGNSLAAHCVGAGKTLEMVMLAMELKRLGMANKPVISVPNHMLYQLSSEAMTFYPDAKVALISKTDLQKDKRRAMLGRIALNDWDVVIVTHSVMDKITIPYSFEQNIVADEVEKLDSELSEAKAQLEGGEQRRTIRQIQKAKLKLMTDLESRMDVARSSGESLDMAQLGFDTILVDEAHAFKNLRLDSSTTAPGLSSSASNKAWNLYLKTRYLMHHHGGQEKGTYFFTGTPISNSMAELYTVGRYLKPNTFKDMGVANFADWLGVYGQVTTEFEMLPEGSGFHMKQRLNKFRNVPELVTSFRLFADVKTRDDLNLPTPSYKEHNVTANATAWQKLYSDELTFRAKQVRDRSVDASVDNLLKIVGDGRRSAMDMRLIHPELPNEKNTKLALASDNIVHIFNEHHESNAAQIVFCDVSTPGSKKPFDAYTELRKQLTDKGVPLNTIAFIHDHDKDEAKLALFKQVRSGEVRVLVGSTEKLGTGANIQERLIALHNLDAPWRPGDLEQRMGRVVRQGNIFSDVQIFNYTTKDSFDLFMWETNKRKAAFIQQVMRDPKTASRTMSDDSDLNYAEVVAVTTGNPAIREKVQVDSDVDRLSRMEAMHYASESRRVRQLEKNEQALSRAQSRLIDCRDDVKTIQESLSSLPKCHEIIVEVNSVIPEIQDGPTTWLYKTEGAKALSAAAHNVCSAPGSNTVDEMAIGTVYGVGVSIVPREHLGRLSSFTLALLQPTDIRFSSFAPHVNLKRIVTEISENVVGRFNDTKKMISSLEALKSTEDRIQHDFPRQTELSALRTRQTALILELATSADNDSGASLEERVSFDEALGTYLEERALDSEYVPSTEQVYERVIISNGQLSLM